MTRVPRLNICRSCQQLRDPDDLLVITDRRTAGEFLVCRPSRPAPDTFAGSCFRYSVASYLRHSVATNFAGGPPPRGAAS